MREYRGHWAGLVSSMYVNVFILVWYRSGTVNSQSFVGHGFALNEVGT